MTAIDSVPQDILWLIIALACEIGIDSAGIIQRRSPDIDRPAARRLRCMMTICRLWARLCAPHLAGMKDITFYEHDMVGIEFAWSTSIPCAKFDESGLYCGIKYIIFNGIQSVNCRQRKWASDYYDNTGYALGYWGKRRRSHSVTHYETQGINRTIKEYFGRDIRITCIKSQDWQYSSWELRNLRRSDHRQKLTIKGLIYEDYLCAFARILTIHDTNHNLLFRLADRELSEWYSNGQLKCTISPDGDVRTYFADGQREIYTENNVTYVMHANGAPRFIIARNPDETMDSVWVFSAALCRKVPIPYLW